jgi:hypothetical protein
MRLYRFLPLTLALVAFVVLVAGCGKGGGGY